MVFSDPRSLVHNKILPFAQNDSVHDTFLYAVRLPQHSLPVLVMINCSIERS